MNKMYYYYNNSSAFKSFQEMVVKVCWVEKKGNLVEIMNMNIVVLCSGQIKQTICHSAGHQEIVFDAFFQIIQVQACKLLSGDVPIYYISTQGKATALFVMQ